MPVTKVITLNNGIPTEVVPATTSSGSSSAGQLVALNSSGQVDSTMLPTSGSSGPSMSVPRDMFFHMLGVDGNGSGFTPFNCYKGQPTHNNATGGSADFRFNGQYSHEAMSEFHLGVTGTTLTSCMNWALNLPRIPAGLDSSSRIICSLYNTTNIIAWISLFDAGLDGLTTVAGSPDLGFSSASPMIALRYYPDSPVGDTNWMLYICDGVNASQIIDTGVPPTVADSNGRVPLQVFDAWYTAANVLTVAIDGVVVVGPMSPTHTLIGAPQIYPFGQNRGLQSTFIVQNTTSTAVSAGYSFAYIGCNGDAS